MPKKWLVVSELYTEVQYFRFYDSVWGWSFGICYCKRQEWICKMKIVAADTFVFVKWSRWGKITVGDKKASQWMVIKLAKKWEAASFTVMGKVVQQLYLSTSWCWYNVNKNLENTQGSPSAECGSVIGPYSHCLQNLASTSCWTRQPCCKKRYVGTYKIAFFKLS